LPLTTAFNNFVVNSQLYSLLSLSSIKPTYIYLIKMPPKKEVVAGEALLSGFLDKETKLLAAAFLSSTAPDKVCHITNGVYNILT